MKKNYFYNLMLLSIIFMLFISKSFSQYCEPYYYSAGNYMGINYISVADIENYTDWPYSPGYNYYSYLTATMMPGQKVSFTVEFGNSYDMGLSIFIDWNGDGSFDSKSELAWNSGSDQSASGYSGAFTVPKDAKVGVTRMRIMSEYYYSYMGYPPEPCNYYDYGEAEDYNVNIIPPPPNAAIVSIDNPKTPFSLGFNQVTTTFTNKNDNQLNSFDMDWYVNNVYQGTYNWSGSIKKDEQIQIVLGNFDFQYPPQGPFNPFDITLQIRNQNGDGIDEDYGNDRMSVLVAPVLNDAGVIGFFGPAAGFGPGSTVVKARVKNYAPKPLNSVRIRWMIDGIEQPSFTKTGLSIAYLNTQDIDVGTYTFYNKTPMGPFTVKAWVEVPNGVIDEVKGNDEYNGGIGPSFVPGTYTIGGYGAHFAAISDASSYLSASGIMGGGDLYFDIRPGTYNGQILLNANLVNNNNVEFRSSTGRSSDVIVQATPSNLNNYVIMLDGMKNIKFSNLTFKNNATNNSLAGKILVVNNGSNIKANYCNFYGVASSPRNAAYTNITLTNTNMAYLTNCIVINGSIGITNEGATKITYSLFDENIISDYSWMAINNKMTTLDNNLLITNNVIRNTNTVKPPYGISSVNGTVIKNNIIEGLNGTGTDAKESGIYISATSLPTDMTEVVGNKIINLINVNGIYAENTKAKILKNLVNSNLSSASTMSLINISNTSGYAGNNMFNGGNISGFRTNSPDFYFLYNTLVNNSTTYPAVYSTVNTGTIHRNIFQNNGTGVAADYWGTVNTGENNYYSAGTTLVKYNGVTYTFAGFQALGMDKNSSNKAVQFEDVALNNLKIKTYFAEILKNTPMTGMTEPMLSEIQNFDYEGQPRASYYVGSDEIKLEILIDAQSNGIIDCIGGLNNNISVSARMSYGAIPTYQWEKDGTIIVGQNKEIMFFTAMKLSDNGVYRCKVIGPGDTKAVYSNPVTVYVLTPTEITEEPVQQIIPTGATAMFTFQAHINGRKVEDALKMNEISIQWYKVKSGGDVALTDDKRIAGAKSNLLSIKNFVVADEGEYYAVITGLCGTATTAKAALKSEELKVTITTQPISSTNCEGMDVIYSVDATTPSAKTLAYQWYKGTSVVPETSTEMGTKSKHLTLYAVNSADAGAYYCEVSLEGTSISEKSSVADLTVGLNPVIKTQPADVQVQIGKSFSLTVELFDETDATYEWFIDGKSIGAAKSYMSNTAKIEDAGSYYVIAKNSCGEIKSAVVKVVVTTGTTDVFDAEEAGYRLSNLYPTPSNETAQLNYTIANSGNVRISIADLSGREVMEVLNETATAGTKSLQINVSNLSNGIYYVIMNTGSVKLMQRLSVVK